MARSSADDVIVASVGARVREMRTTCRWTQAQLGEASGLDAQQIAFIERGEREPRISTLARIAAGLDVSLPELLGGVGHER